MHVNQFDVRKNEPFPLRVKTSKENIPAKLVHINGPSVVMYYPDLPLSCGAKAWVETKAEVYVYDKEDKLK